MEVAGHWTVDGVRSDFQATMPTNFVTTARRLSFELVRKGDPGIFKIELAPDRTDFGLMFSESEYGVRGDIQFHGGKEDRMLVSYASESPSLVDERPAIPTFSERAVPSAP